MTYHRSERTSGRQWRSMQLPAYADAHKIAARIDNGVLTICAPKIEGIEVRRAPGHPRSPVACGPLPHRATSPSQQAGGRRRIAVQGAAPSLSNA